MMTEDTLVQMLLEVAGGAVTDERDIVLARSAARWAHRHGWKLHLHNSFFIELQALSWWILAVRAEQLLEIRVRLEPGQGWLTHSRHQIADLGHGLNVLAAERLIPARFCTLGREALEDYAEAIDRGAAEMAGLADLPGAAAAEGDHYGWEMRIRAATLNQAADQARAFPRSELAVMT